jgi:hypothetical protein
MIFEYVDACREPAAPLGVEDDAGVSIGKLVPGPNHEGVSDRQHREGTYSPSGLVGGLVGGLLGRSTGRSTDGPIWARGTTCDEDDERDNEQKRCDGEGSEHGR